MKPWYESTIRTRTVTARPTTDSWRLRPKEAFRLMTRVDAEADTWTLVRPRSVYAEKKM